MKRSLRNVLTTAAAAAWLVGCGPRDQQPAAPPSPAQESPTDQTPGTAETIQSTGAILGVRIGAQISEARDKLDPLRAAGSYPPDEKELQGRRIYWKLAGTEYDWIMVWADKQGKVTRVRAVFRPEHQKPFAEIGDLASALTADSHAVRWNLKTPAGSPFRLAAQGADGRAVSVYMFSQELTTSEHEHTEPQLEEKK